VVSPANPELSFDTGLQATTPVGVELIDYNETFDVFGKNAYSGIGNQTQINDTFTRFQFTPGPITAALAAGGFQRWTEPTVLPKPLYPTFGTNADISKSTQLFPNPNYARGDCRLFTDKAATNVADTNLSGFFVNGYCTANCYTPDQKIAFARGEETILDAVTALRTGVTTLAPTSTLERIQLKTDDVAAYTRDLHDGTSVIIEIRTASGGELRVTDKHPVLEGTGRIMEARSLKVGNKLIKADGSLDRIVSVVKSSYFGKVYNLKPKSANRVSNLLIAQGFLVGSSRYQSEDVDYLNRIVLGRSIPAHVIPR
jgi:hypothetical protein